LPQFDTYADEDISPDIALKTSADISPLKTITQQESLIMGAKEEQNSERALENLEKNLKNDFNLPDKNPELIKENTHNTTTEPRSDVSAEGSNAYSKAKNEHSNIGTPTLQEVDSHRVANLNFTTTNE
jgi:hypothetical protein